jgi:hypothetical protein
LDFPIIATSCILFISFIHQLYPSSGRFPRRLLNYLANQAKT